MTVGVLILYRRVIRAYARYAPSIGAVAALLAGCSGSQPAIVMPRSQTSAIVMHAERGSSWMLPEAKSRDLLYVVDDLGGDVDVLTYPGYKLVGTLTGFLESAGACSDSQGNVWIANTFAEALVEYAHGGTTPIETLSEPNEYPISCSFDRKTGDLAVSNFSESAPPNVAIFQNETGPPVIYPDLKMAEIFYLSYGPSSKLFFDGVNGNNFAMGRFHNGTLAKIRIRGAKIYNGPQIAGGVQYANGMLTTTSIGPSSNTALIYRMTDSGVIKGSTPLLGAGYCLAYLIWKSAVICPSGNYNGLVIYRYPQGGKYTREVPLHCCAIQAVMSVARAGRRKH